MPLWGWFAIAVLLALVAVWVRAESRRRDRPVDPAFVERDPAERRVDRDAQRRAMEIKYNDPGW